MHPVHPAPAPLFRDPITDGAADPTVVYNPLVKEWWMFYTQRRANIELPGVAYCYGNPIGVTASRDNGRSWVYKGTLSLDFEPGVNTFWAPEIVFDGHEYHLFVTYIRGVPLDWGNPMQTAHYTSRDLWNWQFHDFADFDSNSVLDITIKRMPDGLWRVWYKDHRGGGSISTSTSPDLVQWKRDTLPAVAGGHHEGPNVFHFNDSYWLITDEWRGQRVYRSDDAIRWKKQSRILTIGGTRPQDTPEAAHASVVVTNGHAYIFYFTHPGRTHHGQSALDENGNIPYKLRHSLIQVAELREEAGTLVCDRDAPFDFYLPND